MMERKRLSCYFHTEYNI